MNRNSDTSPVPNDADEPEETISHGDGALELEPPEEGTTIENPPDGGLRAWMIVLACTGINALFSIMHILIRVCLLDDDMSSDTGIDSDTLEEMDEQLIALSDVYAPIAAFVMIFLGYQATVCIGAGVVMITVVVLSYLGDDDTEKLIKFILYGPTAIGISFIQLGALIPVLEYFTSKRMKALFLSRLGTFVGQIILIIILITSSSTVTVKWREFLRGCTGLCIGIGLLGLTLKELKLKMKDDKSVTFVQRTLGLAKKDILKNVLFWLTCIVYFFYQWGIETPQAQFTDSDMTDRLDLDNSLTKALLYGLSPTIGLALGMFLAWMFKKVAYDEKSRLHVETLKADRMNIIFGILVVAAATMGIGCFIAPHAKKFGYFFPFSLLFATFFVFCEGLRDDAVPDEFGRDNVRIVEGLILMFAGLGGIITNEIGGDIDEGEPDDWKYLFRYGGGMLLLSSIVTSLVLCLKQSKALDAIHSKIHGNTVVPLRVNDNQQNGRRENTRQAHQNFDSVRNPKFSHLRTGKAESSLKERHNVNQGVGPRPYQQPIVPPAVRNGGLQPDQQSRVQSTTQSGGFQPVLVRQGVPGGFQSDQQSRVQSTTQSGGFQPVLVRQGVPGGFQPVLVRQGVPGGFQPYQQSGVQSTTQTGGFQPVLVRQEIPGGFQPYQPSEVQSTTQIGGFQPVQVQQEIPGGFQPYQPSEVQSTTQIGGFPPFQVQQGVPGGVQPYQQSGVQSTTQIGGFQPFQVQQAVPSTSVSGGFLPYQQQ